jgi:hypothetical protein
MMFPVIAPNVIVNAAKPSKIRADKVRMSDAEPCILHALRLPMIRAISATCIALVLLLGGQAHAGKQLIAVLGLEVVDQQGGTPTPQDTQVAKALTEGLRGRAKLGSGPFQIAGNSDKELIDEKLLKNCDTEAPTCMAQIGADLGADVLMYGRIEKQGKSYAVTMKLLDVHRKLVEKSSNDTIPPTQTSEAEINRWAVNIYKKLTGQNTGGQILVKVANADRGTILINGEEKGNITNGTGQVNGLEEGKYKVAIEAGGFRRWEESVTVKAGETTNVPVKLEKVPDQGGGTGPVIEPPGGGGGTPVGHGGGGGGGTGMWKGVFLGSVAVGLAGGAWWINSFQKGQHYEQLACEANFYSNVKDAPVGCTDTFQRDNTYLNYVNGRMTAWQNQSYVGGVIVGVGAVVGAIAFYKGFVATSGSSSEHAANGHRVHRDRFVVTPIISPSGAGVRLDW